MTNRSILVSLKTVIIWVLTKAAMSQRLKT
jgi:hypothetical protein